jgi:NTP pyrophosphatase (non-canonical NTP hydrolase)
MTSLKDLHAANIARQAEWCPDQVPDLSFRGNELGGECGEAQNVIKKLERERHGWRGSRATLDDLAQELADVVICADLCAVTAGIDLGAAVVAKFNATSEKVGLKTMLSAIAAEPVSEPYRAALEQIAAERVREFIGEDYVLPGESPGWHEHPTAAAKIAIAALAAEARDMARAGAAGGADGFVLVPREPTPKMVASTWNDHVDASGGIESQNARNKRIYRAMIAAAPPGPWCPQLTGADRLGRDRKGDVTINVPTALCWLQFRPACSTGTDEQTRPGVGFSLVAYPGSHGEWPSGVIPRDEATKLHEMLGRFLAQPDRLPETATGGETDA